MRECDVEKVMAGNTQAQALHVFFTHRPIQHALVVGISGLLGRFRSNRPAGDLCMDVLHGQISPLDQANLNARPACVDALAAELRQVLNRTEGIGKVRLQHNSGF